MKQGVFGNGDEQAVLEGVCTHLAVVPVEDAEHAELLVQVRLFHLFLFLRQGATGSQYRKTITLAADLTVNFT